MTQIVFFIVATIFLVLKFTGLVKHTRVINKLPKWHVALISGGIAVAVMVAFL